MVISARVNNTGIGDGWFIYTATWIRIRGSCVGDEPIPPPTTPALPQKANVREECSALPSNVHPFIQRVEGGNGGAVSPSTLPFCLCNRENVCPTLPDHSLPPFLYYLPRWQTTLSARLGCFKCLPLEVIFLVRLNALVD